MSSSPPPGKFSMGSKVLSLSGKFSHLTSYLVVFPNCFLSIIAKNKKIFYLPLCTLNLHLKPLFYLFDLHICQFIQYFVSIRIYTPMYHLSRHIPSTLFCTQLLHTLLFYQQRSTQNRE